VESKDPYIDVDDFPVLEGVRMCLRCKCCAVGVGSYELPFEGPWGGEGRYLPMDASSLKPEPSVDPSGEPDAWYCTGGCNERGEHRKERGRQKKYPLPPSFIGRVKNPR
jgi:hypothetical protein